MNTIRNFSIIAHIDHGKSTIADRLLEATKTVEKRKMREQMLDQMELERERGITIKMQPVRMNYVPLNNNKLKDEYTLNLIDTPGHIDFSYEVSRALKAVEGTLLLVDATQGVQAQTLTTLAMAKDIGLVIVPVLSKIDSPIARIKEVSDEIVKLLDCDHEDIIHTSGKTGEGVLELLNTIVERIPAPKTDTISEDDLSALVFDFQYGTHRGIVVYVRVFGGSIKKGDNLVFKVAGESFGVLETGIFTPEEKPVESLSSGEIGYIVTGLKEAGVASVGDTIVAEKSSTKAMPGYQKPRPVVWASFYPESQDDFTLLKQSLERLHLSDSALSFEEETSGVLGRGFRCGMLGMLHLEIVTERLKREFNLELIVTSPNVTYEVESHGGAKEMVYSPIQFPKNEKNIKVYEPWVALNIITPNKYISSLMQLLYDHEASATVSENFGEDRTMFLIEMSLRELMRNFFGKIKTATSGFASLSYEIADMRPADVVRLDVHIAEEIVPAFSRIVARRRVEEEAERIVDKLKKTLPRQLFITKIQAIAMGRILASRKLSALKKDVTGHLYGGDITRKRKLWEKQKKGKKRMREQGKVNIPQDVFLKMMKSD